MNFEVLKFIKGFLSRSFQGLRRVFESGMAKNVLSREAARNIYWALLGGHAPPENFEN